ncbi:uncharacterized protein TNCT_202521 [Trichonephila clavata]|uniref:Uncharacterized protein n=1 Tax=Trichonephila clavata TaxID=2740835 RepID=A0A8X6IW31_TRICU|nr:uncharacterized protein TNCT_202521 [Trichonephila clavata]
MPENKTNQYHSESLDGIGIEDHEPFTRTTMQPRRTSYTHFGYQNTESLDSEFITAHCQGRNEGSNHLYTDLESLRSMARHIQKDAPISHHLKKNTLILNRKHGKKMYNS